MPLAIYPGTFDPITLGHTALIKRAVALFGHVVVAIPENPPVQACFSLEERVELANAVLKPLREGVDVLTFRGTLVEFATKHQGGECVIVRGLRSECDCSYELRLAHINQTLQPAIETVFLVSTPALSPVSASMVREVARLGGSVDAFVDPIVGDALRRKFKQDR